MDLSLLVQICSWPLLIIGSVLSVGMTLFAIFMVLSSNDKELLRSFFPLTFLPVIAGLFTTLVRTLSSIGMQLNPGTDIAIDPAFLIQMNLVPLMFGLVAAFPPAFVIALGCWRLAWRSSGLRILSKRAPKAEESASGDVEFARAREAVDYIDTLVKPR